MDVRRVGQGQPVIRISHGNPCVVVHLEGNHAQAAADIDRLYLIIEYP